VKSFWAAVTVLTLIACVRVASTHRVFSEVLDEPAHLAAGYQWFDGSYRIDPTHPPLARILAHCRCASAISRKSPARTS
jgi:hypothetical protein